jgi:hypothetical protein
MAAEMRSDLLHAKPIEAARNASCGRTAHSGEIAEVIGQEQLPLEAALASVRATLASPSPFAWGPVTSTERSSSSRSDAACPVGEHDDRVAAADETPDTELHVVAIETRVVPGRTGRPRNREKFPFGALAPASPNADGDPSGPCFFIPVEDNPERCVAAATKRHRPKKFITRRVPGGTWVWRRS